MDNPAIGKMLIEDSITSAECRTNIREVSGELINNLAMAIDEGKKNDVIKDMDSYMAASLIVNSIIGLIHSKEQCGTIKDKDKMKREFVSYFIRALKKG